MLEASALDEYCTLSVDVYIDGKSRSVAFQTTDEAIAAAAKLFATHFDLQEGAALQLSNRMRSKRDEYFSEESARNGSCDLKTDSSSFGALCPDKLHPCHPELSCGIELAYSRGIEHHKEWPTRDPFDTVDLKVGVGSYGWKNLVLHGGGTLHVGNYSSIGPGVDVFLGADHRLDWVTTYPFTTFHEGAFGIAGSPTSKGQVSIGSDCWIGAGAALLSGITLGDGSVVAARAVVTKDVPPYSVVAGNPARVVKRRFNEQVTQRLLGTKWWSRPREVVDQLVPLLVQEDLMVFLEAIEAIPKLT
jgi:acetyltransferase-like isoleucine patch superfamily enzyme